MKIFRSVQKL